MKDKKEESLEKKLWIHVKPGSKHQGVKKGAGRLEVKLKSQPVKGQANNELMEVLSGFFGVPKSYIQVIKGAKSKNKLVRVVYKKIK
jgi:hypothetical protein